MAEWDFVTYGSLASSDRAAFAMGPFGSKITKENYVNSGVPVIRGVNLANGIFLDDEFVYITDEKADEIFSANIEPGDLIFTHRGTIGQVSMLPREPRFERYVIGSSQVKTRLDESKALPEFYYYWFQSPAGQHSILVHSSTVGVPGIATPLTSIRNLKVPNPDLAEQKAISAVLGALDDKIAVNERIATTAEDLVLVTASGKRWSSRVRLDEICTLRKEQVSPVEMVDAQVDHYSLPAFDAGKCPERVPPESIKSNKFLIDSPSVLLSKLNPDIPRVWNVEPYSGVPALASTEFLVLAPSEDLTPHELWAVTAQQDFLDTLTSKVTGTSKSHQRVRPAEVLASEVVDPRKFGDVRLRIQNLARTAAMARAESQTLATLRDTLLPQLMSGRLRVRDAEKIVEDAT
ncbi:restriction endonuclease subunit S [Planomonospora sp. ID82291]|uniref:restriction endonuclease subunit S n=1 Tax=Planomonospora sp. ID82291 TaxID=2738136 RepID=UPI0018C43FD9|nr:restriction endonuclease subunit S [Planomonospora sp. ID82291]MBG0813320.1 restriction endonuclease subunit S [Planomonospora sp. ID82291]